MKLLLTILMLSGSCLAQQASGPAPINITVALDGSGQFKSVQEAIMSVPAGSPAKPVVIHIKPGTYKELIYIQHEKRFFRLVGEDAAKTILTYDLHANMIGSDQKPIGTFRTPSTLIDADDVLESGIDIVAQPPGKRLQNVLLLSGGEKAMAALALVLGIFHYRPAPFCLLDEVDAPLDEANVGRFTDKVVQMSANTQFIVITHNKRTMEMAKALYGVTMEDAGVSKLVSVKFE